ncbi:hypothetical protein I7I48_10442 [Histoplasma ohiense]|nr:hypothetical protein I7I48_10442 [Histoplasma ohiense (nom. inval.)]
MAPQNQPLHMFSLFLMFLTYSFLAVGRNHAPLCLIVQRLDCKLVVFLIKQYIHLYSSCLFISNDNPYFSFRVPVSHGHFQ